MILKHKILPATGDNSPSTSEASLVETKVSRWLNFSHCPSQNLIFTKFRRADVSLMTFFIFQSLAAPLIIIFQLRLFVYKPTAINTAALVSGVIFVAILGWIIFTMLYLNKWKNSYLSTVAKNAWLPLMENVWLVGLVISMNFTLLALLNIREALCPHIYDSPENNCVLPHEYSLVGGFFAFELMFHMVAVMIVKSVRSEIVFISFFANVGCIIFYIVYHDLVGTMSGLLAYMPLSFLGLYEYQRQMVSAFIFAHKLEDVQSTNDTLLEELQASGLKHLIGNVAHDLKTPLASFSMGLDLILSTLRELSTISSSLQEEARVAISSNVSFVHDTLQNMQNVNVFMLMTINRCQDYTKATTGGKLTPQLETVNLADTIALPLHVMSAMQGKKVAIKLLPFGGKPCSHIITDKQWLQENIICLLSNAAKYSNRGLVTVYVELLNQKPRRNSRPNLPPLNKVKTVTKNITSAISTSFLRQSPDNSASFRSLPRSIEEDKSMHSIISLGGADITVVPSLYHQQPRAAPQQQQQQRQSKLAPAFLRVEVEDTGIGLSEEAMSHLFTPFNQAQRLAGGTGLGLFSFSKRIDALGGTYGVMKRKDGQQGSVFWFEFPYKPDEDYARNLQDCNSSRSSLAPALREKSKSGQLSINISAPSPPSSYRLGASDRPKRSPKQMNSLVSTSGRPRPLRILLADDSLSIQKMTTMLLKKLGHSVTVVDNGADALELIANKYREQENLPFSCQGVSPFDIVLMDFQMPIMDGLECTRRIRELECSLINKQLEDQEGRHRQGSDKTVGLHLTKDALAAAAMASAIAAALAADISISGTVLTSGEAKTEEHHYQPNQQRRASISNTFNPRPDAGFHQFVVGLSANCDNDTVSVARSMGIDEFMEKPFQQARFVELVEKMREMCTFFDQV